MIYQWNVFRELFQKKFYKLLLLMSFLLLSMVIVTWVNPTEISFEKFLSLVGILNFQTASLLDILWNIFQVFVTIYFVYCFITYEEDHSIEYFVLRKNYNCFLVQKLIAVLMFVVIFRLVIYLILYFIFHNIIPFSLTVLLSSILIYLGVTLFVFLFCLWKKQK